MRIGLVALDGCFGAGVAALLDVLQTGELLRSQTDRSIPRISVDLLGLRRKVTSGSGVVFTATHTLGDIPDFDVVVVCAIGALTLEQVDHALESRDGRTLVSALARANGSGPIMAGACTGTFLLAEAGILDGVRATTTWWLGPGFRCRYPKVNLDLDAMVVADRHAITAGAAFAHIDLALALLRRISPSLADTATRFLVLDERPAQSTYVALGYLVHDDPLVVEFEQHVRAHLDQPVDVGQVASALGTSRRTLERRVAAAVGLSPLSLVQRLRVERATQLRRMTDQSLEQIAPQVGYANASTLRNLMRRLA